MWKEREMKKLANRADAQKVEGKGGEEDRKGLLYERDQERGEENGEQRQEIGVGDC